jgi:hypothetical protein
VTLLPPPLQIKDSVECCRRTKEILNNGGITMNTKLSEQETILLSALIANSGDVTQEHVKEFVKRYAKVRKMLTFKDDKDILGQILEEDD